MGLNLTMEHNLTLTGVILDMEYLLLVVLKALVTMSDPGVRRVEARTSHDMGFTAHCQGLMDQGIGQRRGGGSLEDKDGEMRSMRLNACRVNNLSPNLCLTSLDSSLT